MKLDDGLVGASTVALVTWMAMRPDFSQMVMGLVRHTIEKLAKAEAKLPLEVNSDLNEIVFAPSFVAMYDKLGQGLSEIDDYDLVEQDALAAFASSLALQSQYYLHGC